MVDLSREHLENFGLDNKGNKERKGQTTKEMTEFTISCKHL
jgi:hypothetical protein